MLFHRIESKGLAHYSYLIGDGNEAIVIDPRRDCNIYVEKASQEGCHIAHIMETHRNEDYAIGSVELAARTNAEIWYADDQLEYKYGQPAKDGQIWKIGRYDDENWLSTKEITDNSCKVLNIDKEDYLISTEFIYHLFILISRFRNKRRYFSRCLTFALTIFDGDKVVPITALPLDSTVNTSYFTENIVAVIADGIEHNKIASLAHSPPIPKTKTIPLIIIG